MKDKVIEKLLSGRFYLTIIGGLVFAYSVYAKLMPPEATASIITMIFVSYFERKDRSNGHSQPNQS